MALLSNFDAALLDAVSARTGLDRYFERPFSTDRVRAFKPARAAYQMGIDGFGLAKEQVAFAASGAWDAVGAHWFGYKTAWINRLGLPAEKIDVEPAIIAPGMDGVLKLAELAN